MNFTVENFKMSMHIHLDNGGKLMHKGVINCPSHILHNRNVMRVIWTPKSKTGQWGKGIATFFIEGEKESFKSINELISYYNLPPLKA